MNRDDLQLDFLSPNTTTTASPTPTIEKPKKRRGWIKGVIFVITTLIFLSSLGLYIRISATPLGATFNNISWLAGIRHLLTNADRPSDIETRDRVNILLLGMGGAGHDGAYLTDTIIVASFKPATKQVALVSIPRDLYVDMGSFGWRKINSANAYGETSSYPGGGAALAAQTVNNVIGQPIDYYVRVDFSGFKKLINDLGGVDIDVLQTFSDQEYPDYEHGYQTISFSKGLQHMDGERALQYSRSRHGNNGQGSDFARSQRQMQILLAVKNKALSPGTLLNPIKLNNLYNNLTANINTNIKAFEALRFAQLGSSITQSEIINKVIDNGPEGLLRSYIADTGAYVLTTRASDYSEIHTFFKNIFSSSDIAQEKSKIIIYNGTNISGLANQTAQTLLDAGYTIDLVGNAPTKDWSQTVVYNLVDNSKTDSLNFLTSTLKAQSQTNLPFEIQEKILQETDLPNGLTGIDFVIVIGSNINSL